MSTIALINEERLFSKLPTFFGNAESVLIELAQNAKRAGATGMSFKEKGNQLIVKDNGRGTSDPLPLFILAESDWNREIEENENPAGWGLFFLYSLCSRIKIKSLFGSIEFEPGRFLNDMDYRDRLLERVDPNDRRARGFEIRAELNPGIRNPLLANAEELLRYFPMIIMANGKRIQRILPEIEYANSSIKTNYQGNVLLIRPDVWFPKDPEHMIHYLRVIWYGMPVKEKDRGFTHPHIILDVSSGSPVTPVLPYREMIKVDEKLEAFYGFCKEKVVAYARNLIETASDKSLPQVLAAMKIMEELASQEELDRLDFFYVEKCEPYHHDYHWRGNPDPVQVVKRGESITGEVLVLTINGEEATSDDIVLPEGVVVSAKVPKRHSAWLTVTPIEVAIDIKPVPDTDYVGKLSWEKAVITGSKPLTVLYDGRDSCDGTLYYADDPGDFEQLSGIVFSRFFYNDDGDTWDSQQCDFDNDIEQDLMKIVEQYPLWKLFDGFTTAGIPAQSIRSIQVRRSTVVVTLKNKTVKIIKLK